jgi:methionyl-tRNA formyltransferase
LARIGADLLCSTIDDLVAGSVAETSQDESQATYAQRLSKEDGRVDWNWPAARIHNLIRGLHPWPHAVTLLGDRRVILLRSTVSTDARSTERPGTIVEATGDRLHIATGAGILQLHQIQAEGRRPMAVREFLAGHPLKIGDQLRAAP